MNLMFLDFAECDDGIVLLSLDHSVDPLQNSLENREIVSFCYQ